MDLLKDLNKAQIEAVTTTEGFVRVIAGAGSGKTRALAHRFAYLVNEVGILPGNILCVTFTNKSAGEMRQRIHNLTGDNDTGYINTFHGFCVSVLQEESYAVSYPKSFLVLDNSDIDSMLKIIYEERGLTLRDMTFASARDMIEMKKGVEKPDYYLDLIHMSLDQLQEKYRNAQKADEIIFYGYLYQEKKCFGLDYNDLIFLSLYIFEQHPEIRLKWQERLEYIMIDEFQDIDKPQYRLMEVLCGYHKNLFVVGDPDQTIYTWRGASVRYLLEFDQQFPGTKTIMMMENYRSTPAILNAANSLIDQNVQRMKKDLLPMRKYEAEKMELGKSAGFDFSKVTCHHAENAEKEAEWMAESIQKLYGKGIPYRQMTVLYRAHYVTRAVEEALLKAEIPYTIYSGVQFFGRMEIKDALSYLRMIAFQDDLSFLRIVNVPKRNVGIRRIKALQTYAENHDLSLYAALKEITEEGRGKAFSAENTEFAELVSLFKGTGALSFIRLIDGFSSSYEGRPVSELLSEVLDQSGYEKMLRTEGAQDRLDNLAELKQSIYEYETSCGEETTLEVYLSHVALFTNSDTAETGDKVKLMTVHTAKGLEFPYVFLCGMNEGIFPSRKTRTREGMEEERRLAFVALTRARDGLFLSDAEGRSFDGAPRYPSRFILDIDQEFLLYTEPLREGLIEETRAYIRQNSQWLSDEEENSLLMPGTRIVHTIFGNGTVEEINAEKNAYIIRFDDLPTPRKISVKAKLTKLNERQEDVHD
ncbi:MAG: UvrD-helicase domain-containing protein [Firmicutes bacterium]|nr:UvrD-helicase domain-containing protein [Bacillota bacterium]